MSKPVVDLNRTVLQRRIVFYLLMIVSLSVGSAVTSAQVREPGQAQTTVKSQDANSQKPTSVDPSEPSPAHKYFTDVVLVNQNGERMRFYSDLLQGKIVIISSFFATCQGSCLPISRNLQKVQEALGERVGKDVRIISISVDPTVDTPPLLKQYAKKLQARPGWFFLTGDKKNIDFALTKLGQFVSDKQEHLNILIIGNERTGLWKKAFGLAKSDELIKVVESVVNDQPPRGQQD